jgi:hypothetical protein
LLHSEVFVVKVVVGKVAPKKGKRRQGAVAKRRVRRSDGQIVDQFWLDSESQTFADDLTSVFQSNVARAREANTAIFGSPDGFRKDIEKLKLSGLADATSKK